MNIWAMGLIYIPSNEVDSIHLFGWYLIMLLCPPVYESILISKVKGEIEKEEKFFWEERQKKQIPFNRGRKEKIKMPNLKKP